jgi:CTP:molybdopterin cytidylyltransferase MocA
VTVAGLVLAAGAGSRFGRPKALVELDGELLVDRAARTMAEAGCEPVVVVLGCCAADVAAAAALDQAVVVVNDDWPSGMGSSLRTGLRALAEHAVAAAVVGLVDQPLVTSAVVHRLIESRSKHAAVVASYHGSNRNPVLLERSIWDDVCSAAVGDLGARGWLRAHPDDVLAVACDDLGSDFDIDTPDDLHRLAEDTTMEDSS